ncbi:hypothetical protein PRIPAC_79747, partial [Pristionchus pacificus]
FRSTEEMSGNDQIDKPPINKRTLNEQSSMEKLGSTVSSLDIKGTGGERQRKGQVQLTVVPKESTSQYPKSNVSTTASRMNTGGGKIIRIVPKSDLRHYPKKIEIPAQKQLGQDNSFKQSSSLLSTNSKTMLSSSNTPSTTPFTSSPISTSHFPKPFLPPKQQHPLSKPFSKTAAANVTTLITIAPKQKINLAQKKPRMTTNETPRSHVAQSLITKESETSKLTKSNSFHIVKIEKKEDNERTKTSGKLVNKELVDESWQKVQDERKKEKIKKMRTAPPEEEENQMEPVDDEIVYLKTEEKKRIRYNCPSLEFEHCRGFPSESSSENASTGDPNRKDVDACYNDWEESVVQFTIKSSAKEKELEKEMENTKQKTKGKSAKNKEAKRPFDPLIDRIIETREDGILRRNRPEYRFYLDEQPSPIEEFMTFYRSRSIDGIIKANEFHRENQRIIFARVNPNPNLPIVVSGGVDQKILVHNYLTGDTVNTHRVHFTYPTDAGWSHCGHYFIACGTDKLVTTIEYSAGNRCVKDRFYSENIPVGCRFTQDRNIAIVAMETGMIDLFDLREGNSKIVRRITGMPNITCIDTNPLDWSLVAIGCDNGLVTEYNFYDDHRKSTTDSYFQYFLPGMKTPIFNMLQFEEYDEFYDSSEVKCLRYCTSADSSNRNDLIVTKANRNKTRGDAAYRFTPNRKKKVVSYIPPEGLNLSCATFAYKNDSDEETRNDHCETYVIAGTEEGTVVAFNAESGEIIKGATAMIDDPSLQGNNELRFPNMDGLGGVNSYIPVRKYFAHEKITIDPCPATRITAIDSVPDSYVGSFIVGGWGDHPVLNVYRFNDLSKYDYLLQL